LKHLIDQLKERILLIDQSEREMKRMSQSIYIKWIVVIIRIEGAQISTTACTFSTCNLYNSAESLL